MNTVNVVWGDFVHGPHHTLRLENGLVDLRMSERRGLFRGCRRFRYGVADFEAVRPGSIVARRRVGLTIVAVLCLLPLGPFALLGLAMLGLKRDVATFWCALKDGRTFIAELPRPEYERLSRILDDRRRSDAAVVSLLPALRRGPRPTPRRLAAGPDGGGPPGATILSLPRPCQARAASWTGTKGAADAAGTGSGEGRLSR